jgi:hypothetical protein
MRIIGTLVSLVVIGAVLLDAFEATVFPRRVTHAYRFARFFYRTTWKVWRACGSRLLSGRRRESFLSAFGPLSLLILFACWVIGLIFGFALLHESLGTVLHLPDGEQPTFAIYLYFSGTTFLPLGYGDITPAGFARFLAVIESGLGCFFLAIIISYLPVLFEAFSRRETTISLLDARAGSPPSAFEFLRRHALAGDIAHVGPLLSEWERWAAEVLQSQLSFPVLSYYRSQHDNQSWIAALTAILDICAILIAGVKKAPRFQAQTTFAMARHVAVDMALVFQTPPLAPDPERLPCERFNEMQKTLEAAGIEFAEEAVCEGRLLELREMYEPFVNAIAQFLAFSLPPVVPDKPAVDNWQTSAWTRRTPGIGGLPTPAGAEDDHFD